MSNSPEAPLLTITQVTLAIKHSLEGTFPNLRLQGEISNCKLHSSGHLYFSLKDANAQISAIMYRADAANLKAVPTDGTEVIVEGDLNVYPAGGKYQIIVKELRPIGLGELLLKLEALKIKLQKKGYFRKERKRLLPKLPKRIGVVTSPTGAAIQDILNVLTRRFSGFHLILNPVKVQGEGAAGEIAKAIQQFNDYDLADVLIVGRGGGSIEDLWAFNEEIVADAIYNSRIPVVAAVGHETDHVIAEYVADVRAPTPSAAAEVVVGEKAHLLQILGKTEKRLYEALNFLLKSRRQQLTGFCRQPFFQTPYALLGPWIQNVDEMREQLDGIMKTRLEKLALILRSEEKRLRILQPLARIQGYKQQLFSLKRTIDSQMQKILENRKNDLIRRSAVLIVEGRRYLDQRRRWTALEQKLRLIDKWIASKVIQEKGKLQSIEGALQAVNPKQLLSKGYAIIFAENKGSVITSINALNPPQSIRIQWSDGEAIARIEEIVKNECQVNETES